ncbi:GAF domain-containing SpoIIE family protein phosphatase [Mycobacterium sp. NPDC050551]|uniref:PP2C family protein-serine/threonine phosphatase n=1 Tax=Mycobacterium sp. NPDC050551 TaxID=3155407 RepID=UPI00342B3D72
MASNRMAQEPSAIHAETVAAVQRRTLMESVEVNLAGSLNYRRTVLRVLSLIRPAIADWAALVMPDNRTGGLEVHGGDDVAFTEVVPRSVVDGLATDRVLRTGHRELLHFGIGADPAGSAEHGMFGIIRHPRLREQVDALRPADVLLLGLTARGATVGVLMITRGQGRGFDDDEVAFAERIASRAAVALDSARLYEERARVATILQRSLRPPALPEAGDIRLAARYRPSAEHLEIGGDFYDVYGADGDWLLALGDVCGKGVEAAALTGQTRQSLRTAAYFDPRPAVVLGALNHVLWEPGSDQFVTVVCARVRTSADGGADVEIAVAGHPAPIVLRACGDVEQVEIFGTAIKLAPQATYRTATLRLERGDTLLMFTDGVDEARGADGFYGVDRLTALLPAYAGAAPAVVCEAIEQDVIEFVDGGPHDDIALLAVTCGR